MRQHRWCPSCHDRHHGGETPSVPIRLGSHPVHRRKKTWMRDNSDCIAHFPMFFMSKIHQFFMHLALFSQNLINTNKIETGNNKFKCKQVSVAVKLASKFFTKMQEHVGDNSIPKDILAFAKSFFVAATGGGGGSFPHQRPSMPPPIQPPISQPKAIAGLSAKVIARPSSNQEAKRSRGTPPIKV